MSTRLDRELQALLRKYEPQLARAFLEAVKDITSQAVMRDLIDAINRKDIEAAMAAIDFDKAAFSGLTSGMTNAFSAGGAATVAGTTWRGEGGSKVVIRWDLANPRAQELINTASSRLVTQLTEEARNTVREVISTGYSTGRGPRDIATDLVGPVSGSGRVGGVVGLSEPQVKYVANIRKYINSGDLDAYKGMTRRDKRYDKMVEKAIREGKPLSSAQVDKIVERYSDRLLKSRADAIARTETAQSVEASRAEAFAQYQEKTGVPDEAIVRRWDHPGGKNSRDWHSDMNGWELRGMQDPWVTPRGGRLMFPCDTSLDAGAVEIVNCFLPGTKILPIGIKSAIRREYSGSIVKVSCGSDINLTVTANHPVLTERGWVRACDLVKGDNLLKGLTTDDGISTKPEITYAVPRADELYNAANSLQRSIRTSFSVVDFHGEIPDHNVDIVPFPRELLNTVETDCSKSFGDFSLSETDVIARGEVLFRRLLLSNSVPADGLNGFYSRLGVVLSLLSSHLRSAPSIAFGVIRSFYSKLFKAPINKLATFTNSLRYSENRKPLFKKLLNSLPKIVSSGKTLFGLSIAKNASIRCSPYISNAVFSERVAFTDTPRDSRCAKALVMQGTNGIEEKASLYSMPFKGKMTIEMATIDDVVISHYEGPVYNFESANGLLISDNIITHNCRCMQTISIDYKVLKGFSSST